MTRRRPVLARLAVAALAAALPLCARADDVALHTLPLQSLSPSSGERTLDWRGPTAKAVFDLPPGVDAANLRLVIAADLGDPAPAPHGSIEVRLNASPPATLRPEPYPFTAQVDFPGRFLRPGRNEAVIAFAPPAGECPSPADGAWILNITISQAELTSGAPQPETLDALDATLRSQFFSPRRVAISAPDLTPDERAAFEAWAALAIGVRVPRTPSFVFGDAPADLAVRFIRNDSAPAALVVDGPVLEARAATADEAVALLREFARAAEPPAFVTPEFAPQWAPEPDSAEFILSRRPGNAVLRLDPEASAASATLAVALNGRALPPVRIAGSGSAAVPLPAHLLQPGRNRVTLAPETAPAGGADPCLAQSASPPFSIAAMRIDRRGAPDAELDLFAFAAGDFGRAHLVLPPAPPDQRAARLRLLAEIARRAGRVPAIAGVSETLPERGDAVLVGPRASLPADALADAPDSLAAVLRGDRPRSPLSLGSRALAAEPFLRPAAGGAARFQAPDGRWLTLVTEAEGADFTATLDVLVDRNLLAAFDGRVMRWTADGAAMQDRGPWRAPALMPVAAPTRAELERTLLFLMVIGGLSLGWVMVRARPRPRRSL